MSQHFIKNYKTLASTKVRRQALDILEAGLDAIRTERAIKNKLWRKNKILQVGKRRYNLNNYRRIIVIGIGKAAFEAGKALEKILGSRISDGVVLDVKGGKLKRIKSIVGTHPLPSMPNMRATGEIIGILKSLDSRDLLIAVISGGGSALLCWPFGLKCEELSLITSLLIQHGATIQEINTVRKHLSEIQGGQFARLAYPATVVGLIFSDVPGDDLSMVASGPTFLDKTSTEDALRILAKYKIIDRCKLPACDLKETPKDPKLFTHVTNVLVVSNKIAVEAMLKQAKKLGYRARLYSRQLTGEAGQTGKLLAQTVSPGEALIAAGETTVTIHNKGKGGRNQEVALGALESVDENTLVLSCASDGIDHTPPVAGSIADIMTKKQATKLRLDPEKSLSHNRSFDFFQKTKAYIKTGITGSNVSDLMLALKLKKPQAGIR